MEASQQVTIVIKNPSRTEDFTLQIPLYNTVGDIKNELSRSYPDQPTVETQKLIFAGRILKNDVALGDLLQKNNLTLPQTFHLVIPPKVSPITNPAPDVERIARDGQVPPANNPDVQPRRGLINWTLLVKMMVLVYILSQGGGIERIILLMIAAIFFYLYQVGVLRMRLQVGVVPLQPHHNDVNQRERNEASPTAVAPARSGIRREIENFVLPFIYSLIPSWNPNQAFVQPQNPLLQPPQ